MIEVFKTNVKDPLQADMLVKEIHQAFEGYTVNFDLEDCDLILRVKSNGGAIQSSVLVSLLQRHGFEAEILPDEPVTSTSKNLSLVSLSR